LPAGGEQGADHGRRNTDDDATLHSFFLYQRFPPRAAWAVGVNLFAVIPITLRSRRNSIHPRRPV
jgi:hypothetical protein